MKYYLVALFDDESYSHIEKIQSIFVENIGFIKICQFYILH